MNPCNHIQEVQNPAQETRPLSVRVENGRDPELSRQSALRLLRLLERLEAKRLAREAKRNDDSKK